MNGQAAEVLGRRGWLRCETNAGLLVEDVSRALGFTGETPVLLESRSLGVPPEEG